MAHTYSPADITGYNVSRMRFELGDTQVAGEADTCALCDEEYAACITGAADSGSWTKAKIKCLEAIVARFGMMVDMNAGGMSIQFSQRYDRWRAMLEETKALLQRISANPAAIGGACDGGHHFWLGMQSNERASRPVYPKRR